MLVALVTLPYVRGQQFSGVGRPERVNFAQEPYPPHVLPRIPPGVLQRLVVAGHGVVAGHFWVKRPTSHAMCPG